MKDYNVLSSKLFKVYEYVPKCWIVPKLLSGFYLTWNFLLIGIKIHFMFLFYWHSLYLIATFFSAASCNHSVLDQSKEGLVEADTRRYKTCSCACWNFHDENRVCAYFQSIAVDTFVRYKTRHLDVVTMSELSEDNEFLFSLFVIDLVANWSQFLGYAVFQSTLWVTLIRFMFEIVMSHQKFFPQI